MFRALPLALAGMVAACSSTTNVTNVYGTEDDAGSSDTSHEATPADDTGGLQLDTALADDTSVVLMDTGTTVDSGSPPTDTGSVPADTSAPVDTAPATWSTVFPKGTDSKRVTGDWYGSRSPTIPSLHHVTGRFYVTGVWPASCVPVLTLFVGGVKAAQATVTSDKTGLGAGIDVAGSFGPVSGASVELEVNVYFGTSCTGSVPATSPVYPDKTTLLFD